MIWDLFLDILVQKFQRKDLYEERFIWQDPVPEADYELINKEDIKYLKNKILDCNLSVRELKYLKDMTEKLVN